MPNITIKELLASDKVSELVDKINFNFDQLLLNGGGPAGPTGGQGDIGPIGPRGTIWFTAADIYTTSTSPTWSGTEEMVNNDTVPGYPQYTGDPNKYLPIGLGTFPETTYQIGYANKQLRHGDLYLQETDDSLNSTPSYDGDIWQYDVDTNTWLFTGVNIKGNSGSTGSTAQSEWIREASSTDDILYPKQEAGQDIARVSIGTDPLQGFNETHPQAKLSVIGDGGPLVAFLERSLHTGNLSDAATITMTSTGNLLIQGSTAGVAGGKQVQIQTDSSNIFLDNGQQQYTIDIANSRHYLTGGHLRVTSPDSNSVHKFDNQTGKYLQISLSTTISHAIDSDLDIILQKTGGNKIGIGNITLAPGSLLTVAGNTSIGNSYKSTAAPSNGLIVEGQTGIGTSIISGTSTKLQVQGNTHLQNGGILGFNMYQSGSTYYRGDTSPNAFLKQSYPTIDRFSIFVGATGTQGTTYIPYEAFSIYNSTNRVGIGTAENGAQPTELFQVHEGKIMVSSNVSTPSYGLKLSRENQWDSLIESTSTGTKDAKLRLYTYKPSGIGEGQITLFYNQAKQNLFTGIRTSSPKSELHISGKDQDVDSVRIGTFNDAVITGLNQGSDVNIEGSAYIGFNTYYDEAATDVIFESREDQSTSGPDSIGGAGFIIFMDRRGNMHIALSAKGAPKSLTAGGGLGPGGGGFFGSGI